MKKRSTFFKTTKPTSDFVKPDGSPSPISGGNLFEVEVKLHEQANRDKANTIPFKDEVMLKKVKKQIDAIIDAYFTQRIYQPYYLLQLQANYFCNTVKFVSSDVVFAGNVIDMIRNAFINGKSGMYFNKALDKTYPINISDIKYNNFNEVSKIIYTTITSGLGNLNPTEGLKQGIMTIDGVEKCKQVAIFKWGTLSMSAWIIIWPFILQQCDLLKMIAIERFTFSKKFTYSIANPNAVLTEMELFFNLNNPFMIISGGVGSVEKNRFDILDFGASSDRAQSLINHYNEVMNIYYRMLGRRENDDAKKERNITAEVSASQEQYYAVQSDYLNQFKLFIGRCKIINPNIDLDMKAREEKASEVPQGEEDDI